MFYGDDLPNDEALKAGISPTTVRLAIGIESVNDLKRDLQQAAIQSLT
jgi:cystathionine beta-lyase/cystathionine gamma-synthase